MFEKILIAGRGESALRILRSCRELGIRTVVAHSEADELAMHVRFSDESVCIGPAPARRSYLDQAAIISAALVTDADAIHPGIGFLSENADFAEKVRAHGISFVGPSEEHIRLMGDKVSARRHAGLLGLPVVPGSEGVLSGVEEARSLAEGFGYPVLLKASSGGGGKGMQVVEGAGDLSRAWSVVTAEAQSAFGDSRLYLEKLIRDPRHIEVQILADGHGGAVHLGERDCSIQRRNQKLLEETPSPGLDVETRDRMTSLSLRAMEEMGYQSAGTLEFVYDGRDFYFIEMNTRLQVEHPITEAVTSIDIVREQIRIASGESLSFRQEDIQPRGHAIECRINAERASDFLPSPGTVHSYHPAGGIGVRMDSALYSGYSIPLHYDSLVAKLIVWGYDRAHAIARLERALGELVVDGIETTTPLFRAIAADEEFRSGVYDTGWLERRREAGGLQLEPV
ncbi:MAG: acetyl-CoA carboxylase biotin carboxylase subunit [Alphaproteobacteria bacterium]